MPAEGRRCGKLSERLVSHVKPTWRKDKPVVCLHHVELVQPPLHGRMNVLTLRTYLSSDVLPPTFTLPPQWCLGRRRPWQRRAFRVALRSGPAVAFCLQPPAYILRSSLRSVCTLQTTGPSGWLISADRVPNNDKYFEIAARLTTALSHGYLLVAQYRLDDSS